MSCENPKPETHNPKRATCPVEIDQHALADLYAHAGEAWPNECCGLLVGTATRIERVIRARNLRESQTQYLVDPVDHFAAIRAARATNRRVVGAYHSHPASPPVPSETDRAQASYPEYVYVIVTPQKGRPGEARAYCFVGGAFVPVDLVPVGKPAIGDGRA